MFDANEVLAREQLKIRAKLIEIAAILDRIDRANGEVDHDPRMLEIRKSLEVLSSFKSDINRAAEIQMIYSRDFDVEWKTNFKLSES
ncbi:MAG: hypothetical protein CMJ74_11595 [Planctomycetaceae bacterium]|nr:hypothetical protein [Planctomycetaceae bacterium]|tara:strand:+ start:8673 stop:8933 length:261 start_codon:yes stop_codon:yes gene_type:complete